MPVVFKIDKIISNYSEEKGTIINIDNKNYNYERILSQISRKYDLMFCNYTIDEILDILNELLEKLETKYVCELISKGKIEC